MILYKAKNTLVVKEFLQQFVGFVKQYVRRRFFLRKVQDFWQKTVPQASAIPIKRNAEQASNLFSNLHSHSLDKPYRKKEEKLFSYKECIVASIEPHSSQFQLDYEQKHATTKSPHLRYFKEKQSFFKNPNL